MNGNVLGIFAKEPIPGQVKTRLCPPLTSEQAARLYLTALSETVAAVTGAPADLVIFYEGDPAFFRNHFPHMPLIPQGSGDLGARLDRALTSLFTNGYHSAALIGSDSPDLPLTLVMEAFTALDHHDLVLIPAEDGGYILIGEQTHHPELFHGIPWSTADVLAVTLLTAKRLGLRCRSVGKWEDLDNESSLLRLIRRSPGSPTARLASELLNAVTVVSGGHQERKVSDEAFKGC